MLHHGKYRQEAKLNNAIRKKDIVNFMDWCLLISLLVYLFIGLLIYSLFV